MTIDNWTGTETAADMTFIISLCGAGVSPPSVATCNLSTSVCPRWPDLLHWPHSNSVYLCTSVSVSNISSIAPLRLLGKVGYHRETIRQHWCQVSGVLWVSLLSRRGYQLGFCSYHDKDSVYRLSKYQSIKRVTSTGSRWLCPCPLSTG